MGRDRISRRGIAHVPEGRRIFRAYARADGGIARDLERVFALFPRLEERRNQVAGTLSRGEQQMLAITRRGYVLETGAIVLAGRAADLEENPEVRRAYLGES